MDVLPKKYWYVETNFYEKPDISIHPADQGIDFLVNRGVDATVPVVISWTLD